MIDETDCKPEQGHSGISSDLSKQISYIILAGGNAERANGIAKVILPIDGKCPLENVIDDLKDMQNDSRIEVVLRDNKIRKGIEFWLKERYNGGINRTILEESDSKAFILSYMVNNQKVIKTPYFAVIDGDTVYGKNIRNTIEIFNFMLDNKNNRDDSGLVCMARNYFNDKGSILKIIYRESMDSPDRENIPFLEKPNNPEEYPELIKNGLYPAITIFDTEKFRLLGNVDRETSGLGLKYIFNELWKRNMNIRAVLAKEFVYNLNTSEEFEECGKIMIDSGRITVPNVLFPSLYRLYDSRAQGKG